MRQAIDWLDDAGSDVAPLEALVLLILADYENADTGKCFPTIESITRRTKMGRRTVFRIIASLIERGILDSGKIKGRRNFYRFVAFPPAQKAKVPERHQVPVGHLDGATAAPQWCHSGTQTYKEPSSNIEGGGARAPHPPTPSEESAGGALFHDAPGGEVDSTKTTSRPAPCSLDQATAWAKQRGTITPAEADHWWNTRHAGGWRRGKVRITPDTALSDLIASLPWIKSALRKANPPERQKPQSQELPKKKPKTVTGSIL